MPRIGGVEPSLVVLEVGDDVMIALSRQAGDDRRFGKAHVFTKVAEPVFGPVDGIEQNRAGAVLRQVFGKVMLQGQGFLCLGGSGCGG